MIQHWEDRDEESFEAILSYARGERYRWGVRLEDVLAMMVGVAGLLMAIAA